MLNISSDSFSIFLLWGPFLSSSVDVHPSFLNSIYNINMTLICMMYIWHNNMIPINMKNQEFSHQHRVYGRMIFLFWKPTMIILFWGPKVVVEFSHQHKVLLTSTYTQKQTLSSPSKPNIETSIYRRLITYREWVNARTRTHTKQILPLPSKPRTSPSFSLTITIKTKHKNKHL